MEILNTGKIKIRRWQLSDAPGLLQAVVASKAEIGAWETWCHEHYGLNDAEEFLEFCEKTWEDKSNFAFGIFDLSSAKVIGSVGVNQIQRLHNLANLGYWIRSNRTGSGLATLAAQTAARFAFSHLQLSRLEIVAQTGNLASRRVALKTGATEEGVARNRLLYRGTPKDAAMYSLIPSDLPD